MEIYKDMLEKLKYHKQLIMNAFIRNGYYPTNEEVNATLSKINARLSLFESYISKPGSYFNFTELNYCFEMLYKDIEILYKVLESILINEYLQLKLHVESKLIELESKADLFHKRCMEESNSSSLGTTIAFQSNGWNLTTKDQTTMIDLGEFDFVEGSTIACFANINSISMDDQNVTFRFENLDPTKNFNAIPYNLYESKIHYDIPGDKKINKKDVDIDITSIINNSLHLEYEDINMNNEYKIMGGRNLISVTYKDSNLTELIEFPDVTNYSFYATQDCYINFYVVDGNTPNNYMEYNFNMAPNHQNFSLQNGTIKIDKDIVPVFIDAQAGLLVSFRNEHGTIYAECVEPVVTSKEDLIYTGSLDIRQMQIREYVRTDTVKYHVYVYINSVKEIVDDIKSIYIKEIR